MVTKDFFRGPVVTHFFRFFPIILGFGKFFLPRYPSFIHPLLQSLPTFKYRQFLSSHSNRFPGFRIPSSIPIIIFYMERAQSTDFNSITVFECGDHLIEKFGYNPCCFDFGKTVCGAEGLDKVKFVHWDPFFGNVRFILYIFSYYITSLIHREDKYFRYAELSNLTILFVQSLFSLAVSKITI